MTAANQASDQVTGFHNRFPMQYVICVQIILHHEVSKEVTWCFTVISGRFEVSILCLASALY